MTLNIQRCALVTPPCRGLRLTLAPTECCVPIQEHHTLTSVEHHSSQILTELLHFHTLDTISSLGFEYKITKIYVRLDFVLVEEQNNKCKWESVLTTTREP